MKMNFWTSLNKPILALAPMVGITDSAFRQIAKSWGADVVYSEMIAADALIRTIPKALAMMDFVAAEQPVVVQLMGKDPYVLAEAAKMAEARGASGIDINFGCPANKIVRNMSGVMLMRDLDLSRKLIEAVISAVSIPLSIKVRVSINSENKTKSSKPITILDMLEKIKDSPIAAVMVHGRSFEDSFDGGIRHNYIQEVKEAFTHGPVLANGGVTSVESSAEILNRTQADGLGLARSVIGHPWIFKQIRDFLDTGKYEQMDWKEIKNEIIRHAELFEKYRGTVPFKEIRHHLTHYIRGQEHASEIRQKLVQVDSVDDIKEVLKQY